MRNSLFYIGFLSLLASLLTACSQSETVTTYEQEAVKQQTVSPVSTPVPISFSTYVPEYATTRGAVDNLNDLAREGFTVFAYHTGTSSFADAVSAGTAIPNLMYNQLVTGTGTSPNITWTYDPLKYWPNNSTRSDGTPGDDELVSFFAYGTHANVTQNTSDNTSDATALDAGIVNISGNAYNGVPYLIYELADEVDINNMRDVLVAEPILNQTRQNLDESIQFRFRHALSALGFKVSAVYNGSSVQAIDANSFIRIEEIVAQVALPSKAKLNLNVGDSDDVTWEEIEGTQTPTVTFRLSAYNDDNTANINDNLRYQAITSQTIADEMLTKGVGRSDTSPYATTTDPKAVTDVNGNNQLFYFIPISGNKEFTITVKYHVYTRDSRMKYGLADATVEMSGTKTVNLSSSVGSLLWFNLQLGLDAINITVDETQSNRFWNNNGESTNNYTP